jgi:predicted transcriptional regulator
MMTQEEKNKIFVLRREGKTANEIAKSLGVSQAAVNYHVAQRKKTTKKTKTIDTLPHTTSSKDKTIEYLEMQNKILKDIISDLTRIH